jgi:hypothetical protein
VAGIYQNELYKFGTAVHREVLTPGYSLDSGAKLESLVNLLTIPLQFSSSLFELITCVVIFWHYENILFPLDFCLIDLTSFDDLCLNQLNINLGLYRVIFHFYHIWDLDMIQGV